MMYEVLLNYLKQIRRSEQDDVYGYAILRNQWLNTEDIL